MVQHDKTRYINHRLSAYLHCGHDGLVFADAIKNITMDDMDQLNADWHTVTPNAVVRHVMSDPLDPRVFYVYPPQPNTPEYIDAIRSAAPAQITDIRSPITLDDIYANAAYYYMMFESHSKDTTAARVNKATAYMTLFRAQLGLKNNADEASEGAKS